MSLSIIRTVFKNMINTQAWTVDLIKTKTRKRNGVSIVEYSARSIILKPDGTLMSFVNRIRDRYLGSEKTNGKLDDFSLVKDYDGTAEGTTIYKLQALNELIADEFKALTDVLATPERSGDPFDFSANAYALTAQLNINGEDTPIEIFSMQNPVYVLKNKYLYEKDVFQEMNTKVLNLRPTVDVLIVGDTVYIFTMAGENLFNMEHAYKTLCNNIVEEIREADILSDYDAFKSVATSGHNPRRFVSFSRERLEQLEDQSTREIMAETFRMDLMSDGKIDTKSVESSNNLVRVLCYKGMVDPFDNAPVEVTSATKW